MIQVGYECIITTVKVHNTCTVPVVLTWLFTEFTPCWYLRTVDVPTVEAACEALTDMPPRSEEELDAVTLHNQALMNMELTPTKGFEKMQFLLQQNPFPPETFGNLLLLYVKYEVSIHSTSQLYKPTHILGCTLCSINECSLSILISLSVHPWNLFVRYIWACLIRFGTCTYVGAWKDALNWLPFWRIYLSKVNIFRNSMIVY